VDFKQVGISRHVDHIVPTRLIRRLRAGNPDRRENLECICRTCHGCKLQADHKLCMGDKLGYLEILRTHHFDPVRIQRALSLYGVQLMGKHSALLAGDEDEQFGELKLFPT